MSGETTDRRVVLTYYLFRATGNPGFIYPIYVLYLLSHGLTFAAIGFIGALQQVVVVGGEVPTGHVGDRVGRRNSLLVAQVLFAASALGLVLGDGFGAFTAAFVLMALARTFVSGSADAWLYETLQERLAEAEYTRVRGRGGAVGQWAMAATMVGGGLLYVVDPVYPFVAVLGMRLLTFGVVLAMPKNARYADGDGSEGLSTLEALPLVREQVASPPVRSFVAYVALFLGATLTVGVFIQPIAVDALESTAGSLLAMAGVPEAASLGVLYASFAAVSALASDRASDLEAALGVRRAVVGVTALTGVLLVAPALLPVLAFPAFFAVKASGSVLRPIAGQYLNDRVEDVGRATVLSGATMALSLVAGAVKLGGGWVAEATGPIRFLALACVGLAALAGLLWLAVSPVRPAGTVTTDASTASPAALD